MTFELPTADELEAARVRNMAGVREDENMTEEERRERKRESWRRWAAQNKDKIAAKDKRWRAANLERHKANYREWCRKNPEKRRASCKASYHRNIEKNREYDRKRYPARQARQKTAREARAARLKRLANEPGYFPKPRPKMTPEESRVRRLECAKKRQMASQEAYRAYWREYYRKRRAHRLAKQREYAKRTSEHKRLYMRIYRLKFPEKHRNAKRTAQMHRMLGRLRQLESELAQLAKTLKRGSNE